MGSKINLDYVKHLVKINTKGEIEIESGGMTSHPAIFAAGDATTIPYKQIIVACGDGSNAGLSAFNYIEKLKGKPGVRADWKKQIGGQVFPLLTMKPDNAKDSFFFYWKTQKITMVLCFNFARCYWFNIHV